MATYFVDPDGDDSNPGTEASPWLTLAHAAVSIVDGDSVLFEDGVYTFTSSVSFAINGINESLRTTVRSRNPGGAQFVNSIPVTDAAADAVVQLYADYVDFFGFDISGAGRIGVYSAGSAIGSVGSGDPRGSHNRINFNAIHDLGTALDDTHNVAGIDMARYASVTDSPNYNAIYNEARGNVLHNLGNGTNAGTHGIYFGTAYGTIQNNIVSAVTGYGIKASHFCHHMTISHNLVFACGENTTGEGGGLYLTADGPGFVQGTDEPCDFCLVTNNIFLDNIGGAGIIEYGRGLTPVSDIVANNTFSNNLVFRNTGVYGDLRLDSGATNLNPLTAPITYTTREADTFSRANSLVTLQSDTFTRANQSGWGSASGGGTWAHAGDTTNTVLSILSNQGKATNSSADSFHTLGISYSEDIEVLARLSTSSNATFNTNGVMARYVDTSNWYIAQLRNAQLRIRKSVAGVTGNVGTAITFAYAANTEYWIRFNITGTTLSAKVWADGSSEPTSWQIAGTDTNLSGGYAGLHFGPDGSSTSTVYDSFTATHTQNGWGTASNGHTWTNEGDTTSVLLTIVSDQGKATGSAADNFMKLGTTYSEDIEVTARLSTSTNTTFNSNGVMARYVDTSNWYIAQLRNAQLRIRKNVAGTTGNVGTAVTFAYAANTEYWVKVNITGPILSAKAWADGGSEPASWMVVGADTSFASGHVGLYFGPDTNTTSTVYDSFTATHPSTDPAFPYFVNYQLDGSGDYHLSATSPCIDAGTTLAASLVDFDGNARPRGAGYDIGPYEFLSVLSYSDYRDTIEPQLVAALAASGLQRTVGLIGPDTATGDDSWVVSSSADLSSTLAGYVRHTFPPGAGDISGGGMEADALSLIASIAANDPANKPVFQGEMGDAALAPGAGVTGYQYGVEMADYALQLARAGMSALVAYLLDDDMHGTQWGLWQITQDTGMPRPWFFLWSLLCRILTPGSTLYAPAQPETNDFRALAAQSPASAWTVVLINRRAGTTRASLSVPFAPLVTGKFQRYLYSQETPLAVDGSGFPLASGTAQVVLPRGFTVSLAANSVLVLTQAAATQTTLYDVKRPPLQKRR